MHLVWYLEKEKRYGIKTLSISKVLSKEHFYGKMQENGHQKLVPDPFFILVNNPKQSLRARNSFRNKIFWKGIIKNLQKIKLFLLLNPVAFNGQSYKKQKRLGTSDQSPFRLWNRFAKKFLLVIYYQTKFDGAI